MSLKKLELSQLEKMGYASILKIFMHLEVQSLEDIS